MKLKYLADNVNIDNLKDSVELLLTEEIGGPNGINGTSFGGEILFLAERFPTVNIRINSFGGQVKDTQSIIDAIRLANSDDNLGDVNTINIGMAFSSAGQILQFGKKRSMVDFALFQMHNPLFTNKQQLSESEKSALDKAKEGIVTIFESKSKLDRKQISDFMSADSGKGTVFSASEAEVAGFIDEVVPTGEKLELDNKSIEVQHYICNNSAFNNQKNKIIKTNKHMDIANQLGLLSEASEESISNAVGMLKIKVAKVDDLTNEVSQLNLANKTLEAKVKTLTFSERDSVWKEAVNAGKVEDTEANKLMWMKHLENDFEGGKLMLNSLKTQHVNPDDFIMNEDGSTYKGKTFEEISKTEDGRTYLTNLEKANPVKYEKLVNAYMV